MKGRIGKLLGTCLLATTVAGCATVGGYRSDREDEIPAFPKQEDVFAFRVYSDKPVIGVEFDRDGDNKGDMMFEYYLGNMQMYPNGVIGIKKYLYRYAEDENRNGVYDVEEIQYPEGKIQDKMQNNGYKPADPPGARLCGEIGD